MEGDLSKVIKQKSGQCVEVATYLKVHPQFCMMYLQTHQEDLYLTEIFQSAYPNS